MIQLGGQAGWPGGGDGVYLRRCAGYVADHAEPAGRGVPAKGGDV